MPTLRRNLISAGKLGSDGCTMIFTADSWKVTKGALVVARGKKVGTVYLTTDSTNDCNLVASDADTTLWHYRLGHMSHKGMNIIKKNFPGYIETGFDLCENCIYGKQK